ERSGGSPMHVDHEEHPHALQAPRPTTAPPPRPRLLALDPPLRPTPRAVARLAPRRGHARRRGDLDDPFGPHARAVTRAGAPRVAARAAGCFARRDTRTPTTCTACSCLDREAHAPHA